MVDEHLEDVKCEALRPKCAKGRVIMRIRGESDEVYSMGSMLG